MSLLSPPFVKQAGRWIDLLPWLLYASVIPALKLLQASTASDIERVNSLFVEDAFYYFEIAHNLAHGLGSSFDGIHPTNGYHPFWLLILSGVFRIIPDRVDALLWIQTIQCALWVLSIFFIYKIALTLKMRTAILIGMAPLVFWGASTVWALWFNGLETGLLFTLLLALLYLTAKNNLLSSEIKTSSVHLITGLVATGVVMARLDAAFLLFSYAVIYLAATRGTVSRHRVQGLLLLIGPALVSLILYMAINQSYAGTIMPVSSQAKSLGGLFWNIATLRQYLSGGLYMGAATLATATIAVCFLWYRLRKCSTEERNELTSADPNQSLWTLLCLLILASCGQLAYYFAAWSWPLHNWHNYLSLLIILLSSSAVAYQFIHYQFRSIHLLSIARVTALGLCLCILIYSSSVTYRQVKEEVTSNLNAKVHGFAASDWIKQNAPRDAVFAMGDMAGPVAYLINHPVLHLDGFASSVTYLRALEQGNVDMFLRNNNVAYIIFAGSPDELEPITAATAGHVTQDKAACFTHREPRFGAGPRVAIVLCIDDLVYDVGYNDGSDGRFQIWKYEDPA